MKITRRRLLAGSLTGAGCFAIPDFTVPALAAPFSARGLDAVHFGVQPGSPDDQSARLQRAVDRAARARVPLWLQPGRYRAGDLTLPPGTQLIGVRGATHLTLTRGPSLFSGKHADSITLSGLTLDGGGKPLPQGGGLVQLTGARSLRIEDCTILRAGGNAIALQQCDGVVTRATITDAADNALFSNDSRGMIINSNTIRRSGNGGIRVWQSVKRHDGSIVADNTIEDTAARAGGSGQNGNAINVFRAADVIVRNNIIRRCAFTAVRGNDSNAIQILGNNCADFDETAMYAEFDFEGAVIADNVIDGAENGIAVTNFNDGGRLGIVHGNLIRNLKPRRPGSLPQNCIGVSVEAETAATGNVVENALGAGLRAGYGPYLRNVTLTGNVVRKTGMGIQVSVVHGAGDATIIGNVISSARHGAIVGMAWEKAVTGDLAQNGAQRYPQLTIANNEVR